MTKNFKLLKKDIDVKVFMDELNTFLENGNKWSLKRANDIEFHKETKHIDLRRCVLVSAKNIPKEKHVYAAADSEDHELHIKNYPYFIKTYDYLEKFADSIGGQVARAVIVTLAPHSQVYPHIDEGKYSLNKNRYHLPLQTEGSLNVCENEEQIYYEGELWWFDNKKMHSAFNNSDKERVHIIFDILPEKRGFLRKTKDYLEKTIALSLKKS